MAFEQDITQLVRSSDHLTELTDSTIDAIHARMILAEQEIEAHIHQAKLKMPFYRLSRNQTLTSVGAAGSPPDYWASGSGVTYTVVDTVKHHVDWVDRSPMQQELLTAMGRKNLRYVFVEFHIWRIDWVDDPRTELLYQQVALSTPVTVAAMTKMLSGSCTSFLAHGATNEWGLSGVYMAPNNDWGYEMIHPIKQSGSGSMLIALPAAVAGDVPLDAKNWWTFPYIGSSQNL
ncbi:MAG: hypothetical protein ACI8WB_001735 [Phenylobacterium sp.]|jgi:hypothetical protein